MGLTSLVLVHDARPPTFPVSSPGCGKDRAARVGQAAPMHFVGVDLAWGDRKPTGLAVLDDDGHLRARVGRDAPTTRSSRRSTPYVEGDCLVAIDAPLIVTNATGNRPAEAALNRDFARFDAGAHPSNTGKPEFRDAAARRPDRGPARAGHEPALRARRGGRSRSTRTRRRSRCSGWAGP